MPVDPNKLKAAISAVKSPTQQPAETVDRSRLQQAISQAKSESPQSGQSTYRSGGGASGSWAEPEEAPSMLPSFLDPIDRAITKPIRDFYLGSAQEAVEGAGEMVREPSAAAATKTIRGTAGAALPFLAPTIARGVVAAPKLAAMEFAGGAALEEYVPPALEAAGVPEDWAELTGTVAGFAPIVSTTQRGMRAARDVFDPAPQMSPVPKDAPPVEMPAPAPPPDIPLRTAGDVPPPPRNVIRPARPIQDSVTGEMADPRQVTIGPARQLAAPSQVQQPPAVAGRDTNLAELMDAPYLTPPPVEGTPQVPKSVRTAYGPEFPGPYGPHVEPPVRGLPSPEQMGPVSERLSAAGAAADDARLAERLRAAAPPEDIPPPMKLDPKVARQVELENMGFMEAPEITPPQPGVLIPGKGSTTTTGRRPIAEPDASGVRSYSAEDTLAAAVDEPGLSGSVRRTTPNDPEAMLVQSYPAKKMMAEKILRQRENIPVQQDRIQKELDKLAKEPPTKENKEREIALRKQMRESASTELPSADADLLLKEVERIEGNVPWTKLVRSYVDQYKMENPGKNPPRIKKINEMTSHDGDGKPPLVTKAEEPNPVIRGELNQPGWFIRNFWLRPQEVVARVTGEKGRVLARDIMRESVDARNEEAHWKWELADQGVENLGREEKLNISSVLEGRSEPVSDGVAKVADTFRRMYERAAQMATGEADDGFPVAVPNKDGSWTVFTPMDDGKYYPHVIHHHSKLKKGDIRDDVLFGMVERGVTDTPAEAAAMLDEHIAFQEGKIDRPSKTVQYIAEKYNIPENEALNRLKQNRAASPKQFGPIDQHRTVDLPFWDPNAVRVGLTYAEEFPMRLGMLRATSATDEAGRFLFDENGKPVKNRVADLVDSMREMSRKPHVDLDQMTKEVNSNLERLMGADRKFDDREMTEVMQAIRLSTSHAIGIAASMLNNFQYSLLGALRMGPKTMVKGWGDYIKSTFSKDKALRKAMIGGGEAGKEEAALASNMRFDTSDLPEAGVRSMEGLYGLHRRVLRRTNQFLSKTLDWQFSMTRFSAGETRQRILAHFGGEKYANEMLKPLLENPNNQHVRRDIEDLLLMDADEIIRRHNEGLPLLSQKEVDRIGTRMSDIINFSHRAESMPAGINNEYMRTWWQFQNWAYNSTRLVHDQVVKEIMSGNRGKGVKNALILMMAYPVAGEYGQVIRDVIAGDFDAIDERWGETYANPREHAFDIFKLWTRNIAEIGGYSMFFNWINQLSYGEGAGIVAGAGPGRVMNMLEEGVVQPAHSLIENQNPEEASLEMIQATAKFMPLLGVLVYPWVREKLAEDLKEARKQNNPSGGGRTRSRSRSRSR